MSVFDVFNPLAKITPRFTEEQIEETIQWFEENAKPLLTNEGESINVVTIEQIVQFLELKKFHKRSFKYPTYHEIMTQAEYLHAGVTRIITKEQFIYMLNLWVLEPNIKHELLLAFQVFDTEKRNFLEIEELAVMLTSYGDPFNEAEVQEIIRDANGRGDGFIYYEDFIDSIFNKAPDLYKMPTEYLYDDPNEDPSVPPDPEPEPELPPPPPIPVPPPPPPPPQSAPAKGKGAKKKK